MLCRLNAGASVCCVVGFGFYKRSKRSSPCQGRFGCSLARIEKFGLGLRTASKVTAEGKSFVRRWGIVGSFNGSRLVSDAFSSVEMLRWKKLGSQLMLFLLVLPCSWESGNNLGEECHHIGISLGTISVDLVSCGTFYGNTLFAPHRYQSKRGAWAPSIP